MTTVRQCEECGKMFCPSEPEQRFHNRRCARINQARHGIPSLEDKKQMILSVVSEALDRMFKDDKK